MRSTSCRSSRSAKSAPSRNFALSELLSRPVFLGSNGLLYGHVSAFCIRPNLEIASSAGFAAEVRRRLSFVQTTPLLTQFAEVEGGEP